MVYKNAFDAIRHANAWAPRNGPVGVAYRQDKGWVTYSLKHGTADKPEFVCFGSGHLPLPLTDEAIQILAELFDKALNSVFAE